MHVGVVLLLQVLVAVDAGIFHFWRENRKAKEKNFHHVSLSRRLLRPNHSRPPIFSHRQGRTLPGSDNSWSGKMFYYTDFAANVTFTDTSGARSSWALTADTGSSNLAVTVASCTSCGSSTTTLTLDTDSSSTIKVTYGESDDITSWSGEYATSTVGFFGGNGYGQISCDTDVGAITSQSDFFDDDDDDGTDTVFGILGLAYPALAASYSGGESSTPLFNALWDAGQLASEAFALQICGTSIDYYGYLTVGGYAKDHVDGTVAWLDLQEYRSKESS